MEDTNDVYLVYEDIDTCKLIVGIFTSEDRAREVVTNTWKNKCMLEGIEGINFYPEDYKGVYYDSEGEKHCISYAIFKLNTNYFLN